MTNRAGPRSLDSATAAPRAPAVEDSAGAGALVRHLARVANGRDLPKADAKAAFRRIVSGKASPVRTGALLAAIGAKGAAASEVAGGVEALREAMVPLPTTGADADKLVDTCGTGGGASTFNISTAAALVAAGGGVRVAKHGNRSFTSRCGSADVLEALGAVADLPPDSLAEVLAESGIVFMFAPRFHPAMRHAAPVRRELGIATIMNLLGPLANPAGARRQVVGTSDPAYVGLIVRALADLGHERALVVHGEPGMDEVSPCGPTRVAELAAGVVSEYEVGPGDLGIETAPVEALKGGDPAENAAVVRAVVEGRERGAARSAVLANAAAAFYVAGKAESLRHGVEAAARSIDSGAAGAVLHALVAATRRAARQRRPDTSPQPG